MASKAWEPLATSRICPGNDLAQQNFLECQECSTFSASGPGEAYWRCQVKSELNAGKPQKPLVHVYGQFWVQCSEFGDHKTKHHKISCKISADQTLELDGQGGSHLHLLGGGGGTGHTLPCLPAPRSLELGISRPSHHQLTQAP